MFLASSGSSHIPPPRVTLFSNQCAHFNCWHHPRLGLQQLVLCTSQSGDESLDFIFFLNARPMAAGEKILRTHRRSWEASSCLVHDAGCLSSLNLVLKVWKIHANSLVISAHWKVKEAEVWSRQRMTTWWQQQQVTQQWVRAVNQCCFFLGPLYLCLGLPAGAWHWRRIFSLQSSLPGNALTDLARGMSLSWFPPIRLTIKINRHTLQGSWIALNPETSLLCFVCFYHTSTLLLLSAVMFGI